MRKYIIGIAVGVLLTSAAVVLAGNLDSPATPANTLSYNLEEIYDRLDTGAAGAPTAFTEPAAGPGSTGHTLDEVMGKAPVVDDTNGATAADVAQNKTFWGLTSGAWGLQTGTATGGGAGVPKTGQTTSYGTRDDGALQIGVAWPVPRFTDNSDGTVTDNLTGLIWLKSARCEIFFDGDPIGHNQRSWSNALTAANSLAEGYCGLSDGSSAGDWRLPNVRELHSLIDFSQYNPVLPSGHPFTGVQSYSYWSSTTRAHFTATAWYVRLKAGTMYGLAKTDMCYMWPVRGGQ